MNLYKASNQWAQRPADERFSNLAEMHTAVSGYRKDAIVASVPTSEIRVEAQDGELVAVGKKNIPATLTHFAMGQLCGYSKSPAGFLRELPATLAAQNLNHRLSKIDSESMDLLFHRNGSMVLRGMSTPKYTRIWNSDVTERLMRLQGWKVPPARPAFAGQPGTRPATADDVIATGAGGGAKINIGDPIAPAGLYASDHDMFAFLINEDRRISEPGNPDGLSRGFFVGNGELPGQSFWLMSFYFRGCCGNHIVWDASGVSEIRIPHIGNADDRAFAKIRIEIQKYADSSASEIEAQIKSARTREIAATKDEVLDRVFGLKSLNLTRTTIAAGYALAEAHTDTDGSPRSPWGLAQGLTRYSQTIPYADSRVAIDRDAGKLATMEF